MNATRPIPTLPASPHSFTAFLALGLAFALGSLEAAGELDTGFNPNADTFSYSLAVQADGKVLIREGGSIARLNADGSVDTGFNLNLDGSVNSLAVQADGKVLIGGYFSTVGGVARNYVARLNADGSLDTGFNPNASNGVEVLAVQPDGKVLIGGNFNTVGGVARNYVARLNTDGSLDTGFDPNAGGSVYSLAVQADGKVLIGGYFSTVGGVARNSIARLNADGSLDTGFNPNANSSVNGLAVQSDGKVLIGGAFTTVGGVARNRIARLNANGSLDTGFNPNADSWVNGLAVQADGKVLIGGDFTTVGGVARNRIARLNANGSLDTGFNPNANGSVWGLAVQAEGKVLITGDFTTVGGVARNRIARLANDPATQSLTIPDATRVLWSRAGSAPEVSDVVFEQSLDNGATWTLLGAGARIGVTADWQRTGLSLGAGAKVRATGRTTGFSGVIRQAYPITLANVGTTLTATAISGNTGARAMALGGTITADGGELIERGFVYAVTATDSDPQIGDPGVIKLPVSGMTGSFSGVASGLSVATTYSYRSYARNSAGTVYSAVGTFTPAAFGNVAGDLDTGFNPNAEWIVFSLAVQADGKVLIGGYFTAVGGVARNFIARLNADGSVDTGFNPNLDGSVYSLAVQADGKVLIGGEFTTISGVARNGIARLNADGSLDSGFNPNANGSVNGLAVQSDGKVLIGGYFTTVGGVARNGIARLNANGSLDTGFNPNAVDGIDGLYELYTVAVQADGKVLIGGYFSTVGGVARNNVARLNANGSLDTGFNPNADGSVNGLAVQSDGKVLIGGDFTTVGGVARNRIARLNADGSVDTGFNPTANDWDVVQSLAVQADGKVLIGGFFTLGGVEGNNVARLNANGSLDTGFNPNADNEVYGLAVQADGKVLIGGQFTTLGGVARNFIARLANDSGTQSLTIPDATRVLWSRAGSAPEVSDVVFEQSLDNGATWTLLGAGARIGVTADWQRTGLSLGAGAKVRATGRTTGGLRNGSSGLIRQVYPVVSVGDLSSFDLGSTTATLGATVLVDDVIDGVTERGFVYAPITTNNDPLIGGIGVLKVVSTGTTRRYTAALTGLTQGTEYSYKAYATNSQGTTYTRGATFTTLSTNADLSNLTVRNGTLSPTFASGTTAYTASVSNASTPITVTPRRAQANATIEARVNAGTYAAVTSGSASAALPLNVGSNTVDVRVRAQDGVTQKTYTVTVTRKAAQTITFDNPGPQRADATVNLSATGGGSSNPVSFTVTSGPALITNGVLSFTGVGSVTVTASQIGNANYDNANPVSRTFTVSIALSHLHQVPGGSLPALSTLGTLTVPTFSIGAYEVTGSHWATVVAWAEANAGYNFAGAGAAASGDHPVTEINWFDAAKWCNARTERENALLGRSLAPAYRVAGAVYKTGTPASPADLTCDFGAGGYRLPTAAEWEYAARGGASGTPSTYPGGNTLDPLGWYVANSNGAVQPAGGKTPNLLGLYDLAGNAAEWTSDAPAGSPAQRLLRGGAWSSAASASELNALSGETASLRLDRAGFRVARSISLALAAALDAPDLAWKSGGEQQWFAQTTPTHDGTDAAENGAVSPGQSSWLETRLTGPCDLRFRWEASQRAAEDLFRLETGTGAPILLTSSGNWEERLVELPAGDHTLRWVFARHAASTGLSQVRLDAVSVTPVTTPTVTTAAASSNSGSGAVLGGEVTADGGRAVSTRGVVYATTASPTLGGPGVQQRSAASAGTGPFSVPATGLADGTTYHARAFATNNVGTSYGENVSFTTDTTVPLTEGIGTVTGRALLAGDTQRFGFSLASPSDAAFTTAGLDAATWELRDGGGALVAFGTGNVDFGGLLLSGNYVLSLTSTGGTTQTFSLDLDASVEAVPKPDLSIGSDPTAATGAEEYSPVVQSVALLSRRGDPVTFFAKVANEGLLPDAMTLRGSSGDNFFAVSYATSEGNVTAQMIVGSFATPVMGQDDPPVALTVSVSPNNRLLTKKVRKGKRLLTTYLRKTYSGFIEAEAVGDSNFSDTVLYQVTTTP